MNIFDIALLSEWRTLYKAAKSSIGNGTAPTQMRAILKCDLLTWQLRRSYTHRNGETEAPTIPGQYWFTGHCQGEKIKEIIPVIAENNTFCAWRPVFGDGWFERSEHFNGQWWGPIVAPWEQVA